MDCRVQLRSLELSEAIDARRVFYLDVLINDRYHFKSIHRRSTDKKVVLCEETVVHIDQEAPVYMRVEIRQVIARRDVLVDKKTFYSKDLLKLQKHQFQMSNQGKGVAVTVDCRVYINDVFINEKTNFFEKMDQLGKQLKSQITEITQQGPNNRLEIVKIGEEMYSFANRLDPVIGLRSLWRWYADWTNPLFTLLATFLVSVLVFSPRISVLVVCLSATVMKGRVVSTLIRMSQFFDFAREKRLVLPQQNVKFCLSIIGVYSKLYEQAKQALIDPNKAHLRVILPRAIAQLWIPVLVVVIFSGQQILVIAMWILILRCHPKGFQVLRVLQHLIDRQVNVVTSKIYSWINTSNVFEDIQVVLFQKSEIQEIQTKIMFVYQYERAWFGVFSHKDAKIADQGGWIKLTKNAYPQDGYWWTSDWKVVIDSETDPEGYTYSADLVHKYHKDRSLLDTLRRRKWNRHCVKAACSQGSIRDSQLESTREQLSVQEKKQQ